MVIVDKIKGLFKRKEKNNGIILELPSRDSILDAVTEHKIKELEDEIAVLKSELSEARKVIDLGTVRIEKFHKHAEKVRVNFQVNHDTYKEFPKSYWEGILIEKLAEGLKRNKEQFIGIYEDYDITQDAYRLMCELEVVVKE